MTRLVMEPWTTPRYGHNLAVIGDRNTGEPAPTAVIQDDIGANPEETCSVRRPIRRPIVVARSAGLVEEFAVAAAGVTAGAALNQLRGPA